MKLVTHTDTIESDTDSPEQIFGMNIPMVMGLLREKIYSDPFKACIQEVLCNARDANRENRRSKTPVRVYGLTPEEPSLVIRDSGVGIGPTRLKFFTSYGDSTKRNSNTQTGGFGLGCKSPFAISDSFIVETVYADEDDPSLRWEATYQFYINAQGVSAYTTLAKMLVDSSTPTYTAVKIPVEKSDRYRINSAILNTTKYWGHEAVRTSELPSVEFAGYNHYAPDTQKITERVYSTSIPFCLVIDGVPYTDLPEEFRSVKYVGSPLVVFFNTGEIEVTPTRESLAASDSNIRALEKRLEEAEEAAIEAISKFVSNLTGNPLEQACTVSRYYARLDKFHSAVFKNHSRRLNIPQFNFEVLQIEQLHDFCEDGTEYRLNADIILHTNDKKQICRVSPDMLVGTPLYIADTRTAAAKLRRLLSENAGVYILRVTCKILSRDKQTPALREEVRLAREAFLDGILKKLDSDNWKWVNKVMLSSIEDLNLPRKKQVKKTACFSRGGRKITVDLEKDGNKGRKVYVIERRGSLYTNSVSLNKIPKHFRLQEFVYVVPSSLASKLLSKPNWIPYSVWLEERAGRGSLADALAGMFSGWFGSFEGILPAGEISQLVALIQSGSIHRNSSKYTEQAKRIYNDIKKRYPLLAGLGDWDNRTMRHVYAYIKAVGKKTLEL